MRTPNAQVTMQSPKQIEEICFIRNYIKSWEKAAGGPYVQFGYWERRIIPQIQSHSIQEAQTLGHEAFENIKQEYRTNG